MLIVVLSVECFCLVYSSRFEPCQTNTITSSLYDETEVVYRRKASIKRGKFFPVWVRNRSISAGLESVLSLTKKLRIVLYPVFYEYKNVQSFGIL